MNFSVIKENDLFLVANPEGQITDETTNAFGFGLYHRDTRMLSRLEWELTPALLLPLQSDQSGNFEAVYKYTNQAYVREGQLTLKRESVLVTRHQFVDGTDLFEEGTIENFSGDVMTMDVKYILDADFEDMFAVRGVGIRRKDTTVSVHRTENVLDFQYVSKDGIFHRTHISLRVYDQDGVELPALAKPNGSVQATEKQLTAVLSVSPHGAVRWVLTVKTDMSSEATPENAQDPVAMGYRDMQRHLETVRHSYEQWSMNAPLVEGDERFTTWYERGLKDIRMLMSDIGYGYFPVAGVPWFAVPFGRDSLITALQMLPINPEVAKGTLTTMAKFQGQSVNTWRDEQPGKIMHELRGGELSRTNELPFAPYYGSIDSTPLYLILLADYLKWTGDFAFVKSLMETVGKGFDWIEEYGDRDGDGFVEYYQEASKGIANQGWKDSGDSVVHKNAELAEAPIALCEVQAYVYRAYQTWADIYAYFGETARSTHCAEAAKRLQSRFVETFWDDEQSVIALALDAAKNPVRSVTSNMGQVLWGGILPRDIGIRVSRRLVSSDMFSGYGIRTMSSSEKAYNPLSYHNGSVWPHDNSLILSGMMSYGQTDAVSTIIHGLLRTAAAFPLFRLPELFCGFGVEEVDQPVPYPVSCSPQAWAAASPMLALQALLGIQPDVPNSRVILNPVLPTGVQELRIRQLRVGQGELDIHLVRVNATKTAMTLERNTTGLEVQIISGQQGGAPLGFD